MMCRKLSLLLLAATFLIAVAASTAMSSPSLPTRPWDASPLEVGDQIKVYKNAGTTNGGEYVITSAADPGIGIFGSFCLERNEFLALGRTYTVGGLSNATNQGLPNADPLDARTAFLYQNYYHGTLSNFNTSDLVLHRADVDALQKAIWHIEGEIGNSLSGKAAAWVAEAQAAIDQGLWSGLGDVRVVNLNYTDNGRGILVQDILTVVNGPAPSPVIPEPATLAIWAGIGTLFGLVYWRRRGQ
jgi:ABC-type amino acid transport substrate-binding protein